jgi:hypothetical protein
MLDRQSVIPLLWSCLIQYLYAIVVRSGQWGNHRVEKQRERKHAVVFDLSLLGVNKLNSYLSLNPTESRLCD